MSTTPPVSDSPRLRVPALWALAFALIGAMYLQTVGQSLPGVWLLLAGIPTAVGAVALGALADQVATRVGQVVVMAAALGLVIGGAIFSGLFLLGLPLLAIGVAAAATSLLLPARTRTITIIWCVLVALWVLGQALGDDPLNSVNNIFSLDMSSENFGHVTWLALMPAGVLLHRLYEQRDHNSSPVRGVAVWSVGLGLVALAVKAALLLTDLGQRLGTSAAFEATARALGTSFRPYAQGPLAFFPLSGGIPDLLMGGLIAAGVVGVGVLFTTRPHHAPDEGSSTTAPGGVFARMGAMAVSLFVLHSVLLTAGFSLAPQETRDLTASDSPTAALWYNNDPLTDAQEQQVMDLMRSRLDAAGPDEVAVVLDLPRRTVVTANSWMDSIEMPEPEDLSAVPGVSELVADTASQLRAATSLLEVAAIQDSTEEKLNTLVGTYWRAQGREDIAENFLAAASPEEKYSTTFVPAASASGPGVAPWWFLVDLAVVVVFTLLWGRRFERGPVESVLLRLGHPHTAN